MPKKMFSLEAGGPMRLQVEWSGLYKNVTVSLDGVIMGVIPDQKALSRGQEFALPDGSTINLQLVNSLMTSELHVLRNGQPLPGSAGDPHARLKSAYLMVYILGAFNVGIGLLAAGFKVELLQKLGLGFVSVLFGLIFLGLGYLVQMRSMLALLAAIVLFVVDGLAGMALMLASGATPGVGALFLRIILLIPMFQGIGAINALKSKSGGLPPIASA